MTGMCDTSGEPGKKKSKKVAKKKTKKTVYATREPITKLARIRFSMGITINKGNYESVRIDCSLDKSCYDDEIKVVQEGVKNTVEQWLDQATNECRNALGISEQAEEEAHGDLTLEKTPNETPEAQESGDLDRAPWDDDLSKEPSKEPILDEEIISKDTVDGMVDEIVQGDDLLKELMDD